MKKLLVIFLMSFGLFLAIDVQAQDAEQVTLTQTPGKFEQTKLKLEAGKPYVFEVTNEGVDHPLGFVIAPKGKTDQEYHIKNAYLSKTIEDGEAATSKQVTLEKGEYVYFCPLNPTPQYSLIVE